MTQNTSSKICISKRLTITALLLIALGFSVIVFSTLSSSVNKTTSSKAEAPASAALKDFGGKNQQCAIDLTQDPPNYFCNRDTNLVCDGSLDFWLSNITKKAQMRKEDKGARCIEPDEIPMGKEGQPCRKAVSGGGKQCDLKLVCVGVIDDKWPSISNTYASFLQVKYKDRHKDLEQYLESRLHWAIAKYFKIETNPTDGGLVGTYGVCIPDNFSKVESCGDAGQKACKNELGQDFCFGDYFPNLNNNICIPKQIIKNKDLIRCDNGSSSCNDFCASNNAKCVETCEGKVQSYTVGDEEPRETMVKAGLFEQEQIGGVTQPRKSGTCNQKEAPSYISNGNQFSFRDVCSRAFNTYCCCDKK